MTRCGDIKGSQRQDVRGSMVTIIFPYSNSNCFLTQNQPHYASRVRTPPWTCIVQVSKRSKEVTTKKEKEMAVFPSGQRGDTQDVMLRLRGFESHSSHIKRILTAIVYNSRAVKGVRLKLSAL